MKTARQPGYLRRMLNGLSLRSILIVGGIWSALIILAAVMWIYGDLLLELRKTQVQAVGRELSLSLPQQLQHLLPGLLITETQDGIGLYLDTIRNEERLTGVKLVEQLPTEPSCEHWNVESKICVENDRQTVSLYAPVAMEGRVLKYLKKSKKISAIDYLEKFKATFLFEFFVIFSVLGGFLGFLFYIVDSHIRVPLEHLDRQLLPVIDGSTQEIKGTSALIEMQRLYKNISRIVYEYSLKKAESTYATIARQVAHDIRSPTAAIRMIAEQNDDLTHEKRKLLKTASDRIIYIAEDLLLKSRKDEVEDSKIEPIDLLCKDLLTQKQVEYFSRCSQGLIFEFITDAPGFVRVDSPKFSRILSNLINNAVESIEGAGRVSLRVGRDSNFVTILIEDTGKGIDPEKLIHLGKKGFTHGKASGSGLGLHNAFSVIQEFGGNIEVDSRIGIGTAVSIRLPSAEMTV